MRILPISAAIALVIAAACGELITKQLGVCGNGVIEQNEDCDAVAGGDTKCGTPDDLTRACKFVCTPGSSMPRCPQGRVCDPDGLCRLQPNVCGNGTLESNEDCDPAPDAVLDPAMICGGTNDPQRQCRFLCTSGQATPRCPAGWSCGVGGICLRPSGSFAEIGGPRDFEAGDFVLGDFDANGYPDIAGYDLTHVRVIYGDADPGRVHEVDTNVDRIVARTGGGLGRVASGDLDADGHTDLVLPTRGGLFVLRGLSDQSLAPVAFSPIALPLPQIEVLPIAVSRPDVFDLLLVLGGGLPSAPGMFFSFVLGGSSGSPNDCNDPRSTCIQANGHLISDLAGRIPIANVHSASDTSASGRADEFVLAFKGDSTISVYTVDKVCQVPTACYYKPALLPNGTIQLPGPVALPPEESTGNGVHLSDLDGDGNIDILVSVQTRNGIGIGIAVAWGDGTGRFHDGNGTLDRAEFHRFVVLDPATNQPAGDIHYLLSIGDLNGDGVNDIIGHFAIPTSVGGLMPLSTAALTTWVSARTSSVFPTLYADPPDIWTETVIGDFNRDGLNDFVAAKRGQADLDLAIGAPSGFFNGGRISTSFQPSSLRVGDFNGDRVTDLAFVEDGCPSSADATSLSVVFGGLDPFTSPVISMGCLGFIKELEPGYIASNLVYADRTSDLFVLSNSARDGTGAESVAIMAGTSARRMLSPFGLNGDGQGTNVPFDVSVGKFAGGDDTLDIITSSGEPDQSTGDITRPDLWFIKGAGQGEFNASDSHAGRLYSAAISHCFDGAPPVPGCFLWEAADIDLTPPAEVVGLDVSDFCEDRPQPKSKLVVLKQTATGTSVLLSCERVAVLGERGEAQEIQLVDLDLDQKPELIVRFDRSILVYWNKDGRYLGGPESTSDVAPPPGAQQGHFAPLAFTTINADTDDMLEIAYATLSGIFISDFDGGHVFTTAPRAGSIMGSTGPSLDGMPIQGGTSSNWRLRAADMDLDGLQDLVLLEAGRLRVFAATPHATIGAGK